MMLQNLNDVLTHKLQDLYDAEQQILLALPKMSDAAMSHELKQGFSEHVNETEEQVKRLEKICQQLGIEPKGKSCKGMQGLIAEGKKVMQENPTPSLAKDAAMIAAAQSVEHYEIAGYGCAKTYAEQLGHQDIAEMLDQTLEEEAETDQKLSNLAENCINQEAKN